MKGSNSRQGFVQLARLAPSLLDPVVAKRGFAKVDLIAAWDDVVGPRYAGVTQPERLSWPRGRADGAVLTVRVGGPIAVFLQHESEQFISRLNTFFGYAAVAELRLVQRPISSTNKVAKPTVPELSAAETEAIRQDVAKIGDVALRNALERLGTAIARDRLARP